MKKIIPETPSKDRLVFLFVENRMSRINVARRYGVSESMVSRWLKRHGLTVRELVEQRRDEP